MCEKVLVLRTCKPDMSSTNGFVWPESGYVEAPDWDPKFACGSGLHGWLWGEGQGGLGNWEPNAKWLVVEVDLYKVIDLYGKVKFPSGEVVFCGKRKDATDYILQRAPNRVVIGASVIEGDYGRAVTGYMGVAVAGDFGRAVAGNYGKAVVGEKGEAVAGEYGVAVAGSYSSAKVGAGGKAVAGNYGKATAGMRGTAHVDAHGVAAAGIYGRAIAGRGGIARVEWDGIARAGVGGKVSGKPGSTLQLEYGPNKKMIKTVCVGADGILPDVFYALDGCQNFVPALTVEEENV